MVALTSGQTPGVTHLRAWPLQRDLMPSGGGTEGWLPQVQINMHFLLLA